MSRNEITTFLNEASKDRKNTFVSSSTPLLSNLSMLENIALVLQVHEHLSRRKAHNRVLEALKTLELEALAPLRYDACSEKEVFLIQLIRASIQKDAKIIIDQAFMLLSDEIDLNFLFDTLDVLDVLYNRVLIIDLKHQEKFYEESRCRIIK